jgi:DNA phosphorothioation-associated putative methyltransferase
MIFKPENTAIARNNSSRIAKHVVHKLKQVYKFNTVLDYGCGRGKDCSYYNNQELTAVGYDPYYFPTKPSQTFDLVTVTYVLNVLEDHYKRLLALKNAISYLNSNGILIVSVRSEKIINTLAKSRKWAVYNDGYITSKEKGTFQKGFSSQEIIDYTKYYDFYSIESIFEDDCISVMFRK